MTDLFGFNINTMLTNIVLFNALMLLIIGIVYSAMRLFKAKTDWLWERVMPAVFGLIITTVGSGFLMWIATKLPA